jgi:ATP-dependent exoDNAse (exonuclease V) beta subunit
LRDGEKCLSPLEFPKAELEWISAVVDCEKLFQRHNLVGEAGKILRAWVIQKILGDVRGELRKTKMEQGVCDYDDLLHLVEDRVNPGENSTTPTALTKVQREKYACAVVDEFQDTDHRQWNIFRKIFLESPGHNLIVIGDPKQAIYSFRGADIFAYLQARKTFEEKISAPRKE